MSKKYVLDTNIILRYFDEIIETYHDSLFYICETVLSELDNQKTKDGEIGYLSRQAIRTLFEIKKYGKYEHGIKLDNGNVLKYEPNLDDELKLIYNKNDDIILSTLSYCNKNYGETELLSNDFLISIKAECLGYKTKQISDSTEFSRNEFKGVRIINIEDIPPMTLSRHYETPSENIFGLSENEYLILKEEGKKRGEIKRWSGGKFNRLKYKEFAVEPKDDLQSCALDLLCSKEIPIKIITGTFGSGKTYLSCQQIFKDYKENKYNKLILSRQAKGDDDSEEVGFLKGSYEDKIEPFFKPIMDNLGFDSYSLEGMKQQGNLEMVIPYYLKGRSFNGDVAIYVDECEDLTTKTIKLIGSRIGQNEKGESGTVVFAGDYKQTEKQYQKDNGLIYLISKTKNHPLVGYVNLEVDYRSDASKVFADL